jgi:hypothetical protein
MDTATSASGNGSCIAFTLQFARRRRLLQQRSPSKIYGLIREGAEQLLCELSDTDRKESGQNSLIQLELQWLT